MASKYDITSAIKHDKTTSYDRDYIKFTTKQTEQPIVLNLDQSNFFVGSEFYNGPKAHISTLQVSKPNIKNDEIMTIPQMLSIIGPAPKPTVNPRLSVSMMAMSVKSDSSGSIEFLTNPANIPYTIHVVTKGGKPRTSKASKSPKVHIGPKGGKYIIKNGKKQYIRSS
jgi:hypothetical protein